MSNSKRALLLGSVWLALHAGPALADPETAAEMQEFKAEIAALKKQVQTLSDALNKATKGGVLRPQTATAAAPQARGGAPTSAPVPVITPVPGSTDVAQAAQQPTAPDVSGLSPRQFPIRPEDVPTRDLPASVQPVSPTTLQTTTLPSPANVTPRAFLDKKPGKTLTFLVPGGEFTGYGNFDVSVDEATKGYPTGSRLNGTHPIGRPGWLPDISTNLSFVGLRGFQTIPDQPFRFVYQLETQIDISATSGSIESNSNQSNAVRSGLTSRNTYFGVSNSQWGSVLIGKTDAPYKTSTSRMNPFLGEWGDYSVIMGNTGGDNRVEFATRLDHSVWYESPEVLGGAKATFLYSPGQNRAQNSDNIASGESDCTGGNIPGSGGSLPPACNDGGFSDAVSTSLVYGHGPFYAAAAYERHAKVNRSSDLTGQYANVPAVLFAHDVADEDAIKIGLQYSFPIGLTVSGIFERLHRYVPSYLDFQNERSRTGFWLAATQLITPVDNVSIGWARANRAPGDPGQHNSSTGFPPFGMPGDVTGGANVDNSADMLTIAYKHELGAGLLVYLDYAAVLNGAYAHYALGAGGRGVTTDCHDASSATGGLGSNPFCYTGSTIMATSIGLKYTF